LVHGSARPAGAVWASSDLLGACPSVLPPLRCPHRNPSNLWTPQSQRSVDFPSRQSPDSVIYAGQGPPPPSPLVVERFQQVISQLFQQVRPGGPIGGARHRRRRRQTLAAWLGQRSPCLAACHPVCSIMCHGNVKAMQKPMQPLLEQHGCSRQAAHACAKPHALLKRTCAATLCLLVPQRIVRLGGPVDDDMANLIVAQLLYLDSADPNRDVTLYVNSPGGSVTAGQCALLSAWLAGGTARLGMNMAGGMVWPGIGAAGDNLTRPCRAATVPPGARVARGRGPWAGGWVPGTRSPERAERDACPPRT